MVAVDYLKYDAILKNSNEKLIFLFLDYVHIYANMLFMSFISGINCS